MISCIIVWCFYWLYRQYPHLAPSVCSTCVCVCVCLWLIRNWRFNLRKIMMLCVCAFWTQTLCLLVCPFICLQRNISDFSWKYMWIMDRLEWKSSWLYLHVYIVQQCISSAHQEAQNAQFWFMGTLLIWVQPAIYGINHNLSLSPTWKKSVNW